MVWPRPSAARGPVAKWIRRWSLRAKDVRPESCQDQCVRAAAAALLAAYTIFSTDGDVAGPPCAAMENCRDGGHAVPFMPQLSCLERSYATSWGREPPTGTARAAVA